jgi:ParB/RepB/Spo0J family partition protein
MKSKNTTLPPVNGIGSAASAATPGTLAAGQAPELRLVNLDEIQADPNQPRKYFHPESDKELLESIRSQGILQPILLRPRACSEAEFKAGKNASPFLVVCGERRFRAALEVAKTDPAKKIVPAIIRQLNDDEALEAQIVENLQRKDVHPMEEALAFESLSKRGLTQEQIGARVGKGDRFVRARLVLCALSKPWQDLFLRHAIDLELALKICRFSQPLQKQILADQDLSKEDLKRPDLKIQVRDFSKYKGDLATACFDKTDPTLNPKMGACIGCPFNSATANLFPADTSRPRCTNLECFRVKTDKAFNKILETAKDDPSLVLIKAGYRAEDSKDIQKIKELGLTVYNYTDWREETPLDPGTYEEWKEKSLAGDWEGIEYDEDDPEAENRKTWEREARDYLKEKALVEKGLKSGKYKRALVIDGTDEDPRGSIKIVEITFRSGGANRQEKETMTPAQKVAAGKASISDLDQEIRRLEKDISDTKSRVEDAGYLAVRNAYSKLGIVQEVTDVPLELVEKRILAMFLLTTLEGNLFWFKDAKKDESPREVMLEAIGYPMNKGPRPKDNSWYMIKDLIDVHDPKDQLKLEAFMSKLDEGKIALIVRYVIFDKLSGRWASASSSQAWLLKKLIALSSQKGGDGEFIIDSEAIMAAELEKGNKRISRAKERISELKKQKKEAETKKATRATASKTPKAKAKKAAPGKK